MTRDWSAIRHFERSEWGPKPEWVAWELIETLDAVRTEADVPVNIIGSWAESGHSEKSFHYTGMAVDIWFGRGPNDERLSPLEQFALLSSRLILGGIGWYPDWRPVPGWHVDLRNRDPRLLWVRLGGVYHYGWADLIRALTTYSEWMS
ncbi:MAG: hypothetical protein EOM25_09450 [Deltaproteobacteria bacterium]|nr:hypothetical protein [Deltaproteobacteria bacterium]